MKIFLQKLVFTINHRQKQIEIILPGYYVEYYVVLSIHYYVRIPKQIVTKWN